MNKQSQVVSVIQTACGLVKSAMNAAENIWDVQRYECMHYSETKGCTMNGEYVFDCTFKGCPYTTYE